MSSIIWRRLLGIVALGTLSSGPGPRAAPALVGTLTCTAEPVTLMLEQDYVTAIEGGGADAEMMRAYLAAWGERDAYAVSHVGFGMNPKARYEALAMYDQRDFNGTELRAVAGNFLFSTGANEFAGRYTAGHFDIPVMRTTIAVDGTEVVRGGILQDVFG